MVVHDWAITENYYVIPKNPAKMKWENLPSFLSGFSRGVDVFGMDTGEVGSILLIPRHNISAPVKEVSASQFFIAFHMGQVYENNSSEMVVDAVVFDSYQFGKEMGFDVNNQEFDPVAWSTSKDATPPRLNRFTIDIERGKIKSRQRINIQKDDDIPVDMPTFHPYRDGKKCRYTFFAGGGVKNGWFPFRAIVKVDFENDNISSYSAGDNKV